MAFIDTHGISVMNNNKMNHSLIHPAMDLELEVLIVDLAKVHCFCGAQLHKRKVTGVVGTNKEKIRVCLRRIRLYILDTKI